MNYEYDSSFKELFLHTFHKVKTSTSQGFSC